MQIWNDNLLDTKSWYRCHSDVSISNDGNLVEIKGGGLDASYTTFRGHVYELESIRHCMNISRLSMRAHALTFFVQDSCS